jgi:hypothetical protein
MGMDLSVKSTKPFLLASPTSVRRSLFHIYLFYGGIDTAQLYRNETEAGIAIRDSGLLRENIFITTKYSGFADIQTSIRDSLKYVSLLRLEQVSNRTN